jgi:hypothetical protein
MSEIKGKRDRSPAFPAIPLGDAVDKLTAFEKRFGRHPAPYDKAGTAWGLKQAGDYVAALRYYGFVEYVGTPDSRQIAITEAGRNLLRVQQETVKENLLREAALRPKEIAKFWALWGADRPPDDVCIDDLMLRNGFSERGAPLFLRAYDGTIAYAKLGQSGKIVTDSAVGDRVDVDVDEAEHDDPPLASAVPKRPPPPHRGVVIMEGERIVFTEESQPNQYLKLIASGPIDDGLLEALEDFVKRQRRRVNSALHGDRERWQAELTKFEEAGLGDSGPAETIRGWIREADQILDS